MSTQVVLTVTLGKINRNKRSFWNDGQTYEIKKCVTLVKSYSTDIKTILTTIIIEGSSL